ncbi:MAG: class I SAM-dependent methyltransferase [Bacilli bacterium]|nr:class I SAM-dependent methyltransferase [Bacilli bacterium]
MKLSKRLQAILDMTPKGVVADVGSDHGKLIISLFEDGIITKGYAIENKKGPFSRLEKEIKNHNLQDKITCMFSDGISELPSDVDVLVIAGMGGNNVVDILKSHRAKLKNIKSIIVDAHNAIPYLRKEICQLGFVIADEDMVYEDEIYYEIIKFNAGNTAYLDEPDLEFGPFLRKEKSCEFTKKYQSRINQIDNLLSNSNIPNAKKHQLNDEKERIRQVL